MIKERDPISHKNDGKKESKKAENGLERGVQAMAA